MPATTSLKLPADLKDRIAPLAEAEGKSAHAWMVEAIATQARAAELRNAFQDEADTRLRSFEQDRAAYKAADVRHYLTATVKGRKAARPKPTKV